MEEASLLKRAFAKLLQAHVPEALLEFLFNLVVIILVIVIGKLLLLFLTKVMRRAFGRSKKISELMARFFINVTSITAHIIIFLIVLRRLGVDLGPIIAGLGITGFILGFAFQETIGNLLAGMMIIFSAPFRIGDYVEVGSHSGTVREMDMMRITLSTPDNKRVVLANKLVWGNPIVNYSYTERRRVEMGISIAYGEDISKTKGLVREILSSYPEVLAEPVPTIEVTKLSQFSIDIVVRPWTKPTDYWSVYFRFNQDIIERLRSEGIAIPYDRMDQYLQNLGTSLSGQTAQADEENFKGV